GDRNQGFYSSIIFAADDGEESLGPLLLRFRQVRYPGLEFRLGHVLRIEICSLGLLRRDARKKGLEVIQERPWTLVDPEILQPRFAQRRLVLLQPGVESQITAPILDHEDVVHDAARFNQLDQR